MSLENSVWRQYHETRSLHDVFVTLYNCEPAQIATDETLLYAALKRRLTKKELRAFVMCEALLSDDEIGEVLHVTREELETIKRKAYRKVRQDQMRNAVTLREKSDKNEDKSES